jgi:hypothetical protein
MNQIPNPSGSGGIGAVSVGVSESIVYVVLFAVIVAGLLGLWKLWKFLAAFFG